jgi:penicillin-binding protein 1C
MTRTAARARVALLGFAAVLGGVALALLSWALAPVPPALLARESVRAVSLLDRHGLPLRATRAADGSRVEWIAYDRIDPDLINAFVAVEDRRFWDHGGVDVLAVARAARQNLRARRVTSGASTITMQLARLLHPERPGKLSQALWALRLERQLSKREILEQYLNRVHLGQAAMGVGAATLLYFGASASEVSVAQAAMLAGIAHAPSRDNPVASRRRAFVRRSLALQRMQRLGYATPNDVAHAGDETFERVRPASAFVAPHFTTRALLAMGGEPARGSVRTSLDLRLQTALEGEVRHTVEILANRGVKHAAAVVLDNASGEVLAWVGSPDFWASRDGQTDMVVSPRQPGSALKPFLYALALDRGYTAATVLADIPKAFATAAGPYQPRNYDRRFRGPVRVREALASSYNVPAVDVAATLGAGSVLNVLHLAGFASLSRDAEHYGIGLSLGNGDVSLIELANGYRALANGGVWNAWRWRAARPGETARESRRVVSAMSSAIVLDILRDPSARIPGFGTSTPFDFPFPVAVKTGTSRHFTDNWAVGTTRNFTVAVWAGNFSGKPMEGVSGVTGAGPLLHRAMMTTAKFVAPGALISPADVGAVSAPVCRLSGMRATPECEQLIEWFPPGRVPAMPDTWERAGRVQLPDAFAAWAAQGLETSLASNSDASRQRSDSSRAAPLFRIVSPVDGDRYALPTGIEARYATIALRAAGARGDSVRWFVDGRRFERHRWPLTPGEHVIRAVADRGATASVTITVEP